MSAKIRPAARVLPSYFVSARHGTFVHDNGGTSWQPFGVQHARKVGSPFTACGLGALDWRIFWELPFLSAPAAAACEECMVAVRFTEAERPKFSDLTGGLR